MLTLRQTYYVVNRHEMVSFANKLNRSFLSFSSHVWSYAECPDENECITKGDCHENADCFDTVGSYRCECRQGYEGNGTFCKAL